MMTKTMKRSAFTLIELLVVIAIVAVLAVVVVLVLNPAQLIQQSRDSNRISDMASLNSALSLYLADAGTNGTVNLGSANTVYVSVPDPTATTTAGDQCQGLGLPTLPSPYLYHCAASSTYRKTDNTGWIPVNFAGMTTGSPLGQLPIDPTNTTSSRLYYAYTTNGSQYEVTAVPESSKYKLGGASDIISPDGGALATVFEKGSRLGLEPLDYGDSSLVGYWTFDEGTGSTAYDYSGNNATGTFTGVASGTNGYYSTGKIGAWASAYDGSSTEMIVPSLRLTISRYSVSWWMYSIQNPSGGVGLVPIELSVNSLYAYSSGNWRAVNDPILSGNPNFFGNAPALSAYLNSWHNIVYTSDGSNIYVYFDGVYQTSTPRATINGSEVNPGIQIGQIQAGRDIPGLMDNVRVYNRALSASEVSALYNGGK